MADLKFELKVEWRGIGKQGEGKIVAGDRTLPVTAPERMGGRGTGASPEDLLISAVTSCYSGTLFAVLQKRGLAVHHVEVRSEGLVTGYPLNAAFSRLTVHPIIYGADRSNLTDYREAADDARKNCFIGKTIEGNVGYEIGRIQIVRENWPQALVEELVDSFYARLIKDPYYSKMFAEKKVDIRQMKERQKVFIERLVNEREAGHYEEDGNRYSYGVNPDQAETWLSVMKETMEEMEMLEGFKEPLLLKMRGLVERMLDHSGA